MKEGAICLILKFSYKLFWQLRFTQCVFVCIVINVYSMWVVSEWVSSIVVFESRKVTQSWEEQLYHILRSPSEWDTVFSERCSQRVSFFHSLFRSIVRVFLSPSLSLRLFLSLFFSFSLSFVGLFHIDWWVAWFVMVFSWLLVAEQRVLVEIRFFRSDSWL